MTDTSGQAGQTAFQVDGVTYGEGRFERTIDRFAAGLFTADADAVRRWLPAQTMWPLRVSPRRAVVLAFGATYEWRMGSLAPFRSGEMAVLALVTLGASPAPPLLPLLGGAGRRLDARYRTGSFFLEVATSNRVAQGVYRSVFGLPGFVAEVRNDRWPGADRFTCAEAGRRVLDLTVHADVPPRPIVDHQRVYGCREDRLLGFVNTDRGTVRRRVGRGAARLRLGDHPATAGLRALRLSGRSVLGDIWTTGLSEPGPFEVLGTGQRSGEEFTGGADASGRLVVSSEPGEDVDVDQRLTSLPFDPAGRFSTPPPADGRDDGEHGVVEVPTSPGHGMKG